MSNQSYRDNDDDIFNYDPSTDVSVAEDTSSSTAPSSSNEVLEDIYRQMDDILDRHDVGTVSDFRVRLSSSLYDAYDTYVGKSSVVAHIQSVTTILDQLTDGMFSLHYTINQLQQNIIRRMHIHGLLSIIMSNDPDEDDETFKQFLSRIKIDISDDYIPVYFGTLIRISNHTLNIERAMYMAACEKANIVPNSIVLQNDCTSEEFSQFIYSNASDFQNAVYNKVLSDVVNTSNISTFISSLFTNTEPVRLSTL